MKEVLFYTRSRCCLCDDALVVVHAVRATVPFSLQILDIDEDPALVAAYGDKIPVILVDGRLHAKYRLDPVAFARCLEAPTAPALDESPVTP